MDNDIEVVATDDGLVLLGSTSDLDRFVEDEGLQARTLDQPRLSAVLGAGGAAVQAGAVIAENSRRWVKLTEKSARAVRADELRTSATSGNATGVIAGSQSRVKGFVEFSKTPTATFTNPAALAGIGAMATQLAMQQAPHEIDDHRQGLAAARARRVAEVSRATAGLLERLRSIMDEGNDAVLAHPRRSPALVNDGNALASAVGDFRRGVRLDDDAAAVEARRWQQAVVDKGSEVRSATSEAASAVQGCRAGRCTGRRGQGGVGGQNGR